MSGLCFALGVLLLLGAVLGLPWPCGALGFLLLLACAVHGAARRPQ